MINIAGKKDREQKPFKKQEKYMFIIPPTWVAEAEELQVTDQPGVHSKIPLSK